MLNYYHSSPIPPLAGIILTGAPGRAVGLVVRSQLAAQAAFLDNGNALLACYDEAIARFLQGRPINPHPTLPDGVQALLMSLQSPANLPFSRELWTADASLLLDGVNVPVLIVIGKNDLQVDYQIDGHALTQAAQENPEITIRVPDQANHVLKHETRQRHDLDPQEAGTRYNADDAELDTDTMHAIVKWLVVHSR